MKLCKPLVIEYPVDAKGNRICGDISFEGEESLTRQADAQEVHIPTILARCAAGNEMIFPKVNPVYTDITDRQDYMARMNSVAKLNSAFEMMPVEIKEYFKNDPGLMVEFLADKKNLKKAVDLGLIEKEFTKGKVWDESKMEYVPEKRDNTPAAAPAAGGAPAGQSPVAG